MEFENLLKIVENEPVFETGLLLAGDVSPTHVRRQLSRWVNTGRIYQLRRGLYALATPFQKVKPHPFVVANQLVRGSYVSLQSALAYYGLIPEYVPVITNVTMSRPGRWNTPLGNYEFRHVKSGLLFGYQSTDVGDKQQAFVALPEKALLDLVYLEPGADSPDYLRALRLQNLDQLDMAVLSQFAERAGSPKLKRAKKEIINFFDIEDDEYETI
jgi:predicted transcriptional regulator of viral defense system